VASVDIPSLPYRLYRYRSITRNEDAVVQEMDAIRHRYIWCSDFTALNDPMEGSYDPSTRLQADRNYAETTRLIVDQKTSFGIASFSELKHSELMWAHYAGNHTGICVSYSAQDLLTALPDNAHIVRVGYAEEPPRLGSHEVGSLASAAKKLLSQKKGAWQYEREWRVLATKGQVPVRREQCVKSIYLGTRISWRHRQQIIQILRDEGIRLYEMHVDRYKHVANRIDT
jgi:hypothetical protein